MYYPSVPGVGHSVYSNERRRGRGQTSLDTNSQLQDSGSSRDAASVGRPRNFSLAVSVGDRFPWQAFVRTVCTGYNTSGLVLLVCEFQGNETWETYRSAFVCCGLRPSYPMMFCGRIRKPKSVKHNINEVRSSTVHSPERCD